MFSTSTLSSSSSISVSRKGIDILGTPLGCQEYILCKCISAAESGWVFCSEIVELGDPQCAYLPLRYSHNTCLNHLAQSVPPTLFNPAAQNMIFSLLKLSHQFSRFHIFHHFRGNRPCFLLRGAVLACVQSRKYQLLYLLLVGQVLLTSYPDVYPSQLRC